MTSRLILLLAATSVCVVYGYPSGPPVGNVKGLCEAMDPTGHGPSKATGEAPYIISVSSASYGGNNSEPITVTIKANEGEHFKGIFVQARRADSSKGSLTEALGQYSEAPSDTQIQNCGSGKQNAWGHKDKKTKTVKTISWNAPSSDEGPLEFVATIVKGPKNIFWMNVKSSQLTYNSGSKYHREYPGKYDSLRFNL